MREGVDFYFNPEGFMVFTEAYLLKRGHCCKSGCVHCPYDFRQIADPMIPQELIDPWHAVEEPEDDRD